MISYSQALDQVIFLDSTFLKNVGFGQSGFEGTPYNPLLTVPWNLGNLGMSMQRPLNQQYGSGWGSLDWMSRELGGWDTWQDNLRMSQLSFEQLPTRFDNALGGGLWNTQLMSMGSETPERGPYLPLQGGDLSQAALLRGGFDFDTSSWTSQLPTRTGQGLLWQDFTTATPRSLQGLGVGQQTWGMDQMMTQPRVASNLGVNLPQFFPSGLQGNLMQRGF
jgi:hypothetical protein